MRRVYKIILAIFVGVTLSSCEMQLEPFNHSKSYLSVLNGGEESVASYTFYGKDASIVTDTVFVEVELLGDLSNEDRYFRVNQRVIVPGANEAAVLNAEEGKHFVPFNDNGITSKCIVPANSPTGSFPVVVRRDASLDNAIYSLCVEIVDGEDFYASAPELACKYINISSMLVKPSGWGRECDYYIGKYGLRKHELMIMILEPHGYTVEYAVQQIEGWEWDSEALQNILRAGLTNLQKEGVDIIEYAGQENGGLPVSFNRGQ